MTTDTFSTSAPIAAIESQSRMMGWLRLVLFVLRNWFVNWTFFLPSFVLNILGIVASAITFFLMGEVVGQGAASHIEGYGLSYGGYILTGLMFNIVMSKTLATYHRSCLRGYWQMQFDVYLQHPGGISALLTGEILAEYLVAVLNTVVYLVIGAWFFDIRLDLAHLGDVVVILLLAVAALTGIGLAGASTFTLLDAKREGPNPLQVIVGFLVTVTAGVYFPPSVLPEWLQRVGEWLPQTHALRAARLCFTGTAGLTDPRVVEDIVYLAGFTAVALPIGVALFCLGMWRAQREGSLSRWS